MTDVDITDEAGWENRDKLAAESRERKAAEAAALAHANHAYHDRIANAQAVVDTDISDEAAGIAMEKADADPHSKGWMGGLFQ